MSGALGSSLCLVDAQSLRLRRKISTRPAYPADCRQPECGDCVGAGVSAALAHVLAMVATHPALAAAAPEELRKGPRGGGRDTPRRGAAGRPDFRTLHMAVIQGRRALVTHLLKADPALAREPTAVKVLARRARSASPTSSRSAA